MNKVAVRAFHRVWFPIAASIAMGAEADAGFDGGEFSVEAHYHAEMQAYLDTLEMVANRFGMGVVDLSNDVCAMEASHDRI